MRRLAAVVSLLMAAGCATAPPPPGPHVFDLPPVSVEQMRGRSQAEVRRLFDSSSRDESVLFDIVQLVDGAQVVRIGGSDIFAADDPCPDDYARNRVRALVGDQLHVIDAFVFRDGRLQGLVGGLGASGPLPEDARVVVECRRKYPGSRPLTGEDVVTGVGVVVFFSPLIGAGLVSGAAGALLDGSDDRSRALAALRFGAPLRGGVDAYVSRHQNTVTVAERQNGEVLLYVALNEGDGREGREMMGVIVRDGIVQDMRAPAIWTCRLIADGAIQCAR